MSETSADDAIDRLRREIADLKELVVPHTTEQLRWQLRRTAEEVILESPLVKVGKWILGAVIAAGFAVWFGGVIHGTIQIKSLQEQSRSAIQEMREEIKAKTAGVQKASTEAIADIKAQTTGVNKSATEAISDIQAQQKIATQKLGVDSLPDLSKLKSDIYALEKKGESLNLNILSQLAHWSIYTIFSFVGLSLIFSIVALFRGRRRY